MKTEDLRKAARAVFLICEEAVAKDLTDKMNGAAHEIDRLRNELSVAECLIEKMSKTEESD